MNYEKPEVNKKIFNCPNCGERAQQIFYTMVLIKDKDEVGVGYQFYEKHHAMPYHSKIEINVATCVICEKISLWKENDMVYPQLSNTPQATADMHIKVKEIFNEAREVFTVSTKAAAALLRLAFEQYCKEMGYDKKYKLADNIDDMLTKENLDENFRDSCKYIRVAGNDAVHPRQISIAEDKDVVLFMFELLNQLVEEMITNKEKKRQLFDKVLEKNN